MPLYQNALMSAVPMSVIGVASSQLQFWRQMGATASVAILGTVLSHRLVSAGLSGNEIGQAVTSLATRASVAAALDDAFRVGAAFIVVALVASLFMPDVPLRGHAPRDLPAEAAEATATSFAD
jgi:phage tail sheath gpL-like